MHAHQLAIADNGKRNPKYFPMMTKAVDERIDASREQSGHSELLASQPSPAGRKYSVLAMLPIHQTDPRNNEATI